MTYKSLLTVLTDKDYADVPLNQTIALARAYDAHAEALCIGVDRSPHGYYEAGANAMILQQALEQAQADASALLEHANGILKNSEVRWSSEKTVAPLSGEGTYVADRARFSDLVVMPQPYGGEKGTDLEAAVEAAMFGGRAPVLILPDDYAPRDQFKSIVVAWNQGEEAMSAIRKSLPLLVAADIVRITVVGPPAHRSDRTDPGGLLSQMLSRHGVNCEVDVLPKSMPRISDVLNRHVTDTGSDMMVMGAYGHSRFREAILGGTTRNMLENAVVPVLMAH